MHVLIFFLHRSEKSKKTSAHGEFIHDNDSQSTWKREGVILENGERRKNAGRLRLLAVLCETSKDDKPIWPNSLSRQWRAMNWLMVIGRWGSNTETVSSFRTLSRDSDRWESRWDENTIRSLNCIDRIEGDGESVCKLLLFQDFCISSIVRFEFFRYKHFQPAQHHITSVTILDGAEFSKKRSYVTNDIEWINLHYTIQFHSSSSHFISLFLPSFSSLLTAMDGRSSFLLLLLSVYFILFSCIFTGRHCLETG